MEAQTQNQIIQNQNMLNRIDFKGEKSSLSRPGAFNQHGVIAHLFPANIDKTGRL